MIVSRYALSGSIQSVKLVTLALRRADKGRNLASAVVSCRAHSVNAISPNMGLITKDREVRLTRGTKSATPEVVQASGKPLVVMLCWLTSKPAAILKYATLYTDKGFDVLTVKITPWEIFLPLQGTQVVATELLEFLRLNYKSAPLMVHGFSIGGYVWGEVCNKVSVNNALYQPVLDRVIGQVWDSSFGLTCRFPTGMSSSLFPHNRTLKTVSKSYFKYHLIAFRHVATKHYDTASHQFITNPVRAPALFLVSKADQISAVEDNQLFRDSWASRGVQTYWKCWDDSPHVEHFRWYPKEYVEELYTFLDKLGNGNTPDLRIRSKM